MVLIMKASRVGKSESPVHRAIGVKGINEGNNDNERGSLAAH